jgi:hypothetical protein
MFIVGHGLTLPEVQTSGFVRHSRAACQASSRLSMATPYHPSMNFDLSDKEAAALTKQFANITGNDRYPVSERIRTLKAILSKLRSAF